MTAPRLPDGTYDAHGTLAGPAGQAAFTGQFTISARLSWWRRLLAWLHLGGTT